MKKLIFSFLITTAFSVGLCNNAMSQADSTVFKALIDKYEQSINLADTVLGAKIWSHADEVSFINPLGTENGWSGIKNIYNMFANAFTKRALKGFNEKVSVYGDVAWLTFDWVYDATLKFNNKDIQTKGRETQIWKKINNEWLLVHVHYSGMPVTGQGQGF